MKIAFRTLMAFDNSNVFVLTFKLCNSIASLLCSIHYVHVNTAPSQNANDWPSLSTSNSMTQIHNVGQLSVDYRRDMGTTSSHMGVN